MTGSSASRSETSPTSARRKGTATRPMYSASIGELTVEHYPSDTCACAFASLHLTQPFAMPANTPLTGSGSTTATGLLALSKTNAGYAYRNCCLQIATAASLSRDRVNFSSGRSPLLTLPRTSTLLSTKSRSSKSSAHYAPLPHYQPARAHSHTNSLLAVVPARVSPFRCRCSSIESVRGLSVR